MRHALGRRQLMWRRQFHELRQMRRRERRWQQDSAVLSKVARLERQLATTRLFVSRELGRAVQEVGSERQRFETGWARWEKNLNKYYLQRPLGGKWLVHVDRRSQQTLYFNTETGDNQTEHPGIALARAVRKSERTKAVRELRTRLVVLEEYIARLQQGEARERANLTRGIEEAYQASLARLK